MWGWARLITAIIRSRFIIVYIATDCAGVGGLEEDRVDVLGVLDGQEPGDMNRTKMVFKEFFAKIEKEADADIENLIKRMKAVCATGTATIGGKSQATAQGDITEQEFTAFLQEQVNMSLPEAICCAAFFFKKQELDFDELRRFNQVEDRHLTRLISADTCDTILEDARLDDDTRRVKRTFQRVTQGFIDDKLAFTSICDSNMNDLRLLDRTTFITSLETARYSSNIPYTTKDIDVMVKHFFPRGKEGERSGKNKEWLLTNTLYNFLFPELFS